MIIFFVRVRAVYKVRRFKAGRHSLPLSIHLSAGFAVIRVVVSQLGDLICHFSRHAQRHSYHGMCLPNLSFPHHRVEAGDRGQSGVGHGRVTVREGRQVVLYPQLAAATPAVQSTNASSAGVGPSLSGQLRAKAHCHERLQLITASYQEGGAAASDP
jgi:hypothetical protein